MRRIIYVFLVLAVAAVSHSLPLAGPLNAWSPVATAHARHVSPHMNTLSPNSFYKSSRIRVTGRKFGPSNSRNLFRLIRAGRAYPIAVRSWTDTAVEGTLPNVPDGTYTLQLQVYAMGHHHAASQPIKIVSRAKFIKKPGAFRNNPRIGRTPVVKPMLRVRCPDPAIARIVPGWPTKNRDGTFNFKLFAVVKNVGQGTFESRRSQQHIILKQGGRVLTTQTWSSRYATRIILRPGASASMTPFYIRNWNANPGEFSANFSAHISYDPDIRRDGNPKNDDCRNSNNSKTLTVDQVRNLVRNAPVR